MKQIEQIPLLLESDDEDADEVEVDGNLIKGVMKKLKRRSPLWGDVLLKTWTYKEWLNSNQRYLRHTRGLLTASILFLPFPRP